MTPLSGRNAAVIARPDGGAALLPALVADLALEHTDSVQVVAQGDTQLAVSSAV